MADGAPVLIFASIDISGSTAFKRSVKTWKAVLLDFFAHAQTFAEQRWRIHKNEIEKDEEFLDSYNSVFSDYSTSKVSAPRVWKTNGDEIVFSVEVRSNIDVIVACRSFSDLTQFYAQDLEKKSMAIEDCEVRLSAKCAIWASSFHDNAIAIPLSQLVSSAIESGTQNEYIGISIDAGFRIAKYAAKERVAISIELVDKLVEIMEKTGRSSLPGLKIKYDEGDILKGLLKEQAGYPRIWFDISDHRGSLSGHGKLVHRQEATREDLRVAVDELKAKFGHEFFSWPDEYAEFYVYDQGSIGSYETSI